jgi:hypothetical protein
MLTNKTGAGSGPPDPAGRAFALKHRLLATIRTCQKLLAGKTYPFNQRMKNRRNSFFIQMTKRQSLIPGEPNPWRQFLSHQTLFG